MFDASRSQIEFSAQHCIQACQAVSAVVHNRKHARSLAHVLRCIHACQTRTRAPVLRRIHACRMGSAPAHANPFCLRNGLTPSAQGGVYACQMASALVHSVLYPRLPINGKRTRSRAPARHIHTPATRSRSANEMASACKSAQRGIDACQTVSALVQWHPFCDESTPAKWEAQLFTRTCFLPTKW